MRRPLIIGAGPNGLTAAFYLARAGMRPLVLEARETVGGSALSHAIGPLRPSIVRDMQLATRVKFVRPNPRLVALLPAGGALTFYDDVARTAEAIRKFSASDAERYVDFCATLRRVSVFIARLADATPPSIDAPTTAELWRLLKTGRHFRALGRKDAFRLLRWGPMAAADFVAEWFETDVLQSAIAARGIFGMSQGPWSAGTAAVLLLNAAHDPAPGGSSVMVMGGPAALARAMRDAAREAGAEVRTACPVARILVRDNTAAGVVLEDGTEIAASAVISSVDPRRTFLRLMDPVDLDPTFLTKVRNYRCAGSVAKVNLTLTRMPAFTGVAATDLGGRIHIGPAVDYLERAFDASKYGEISPEPYLDLTIPSLHDASLAPEGRHAMSVHVQFAPYKLAGADGWNDSARHTIVTRVVETLDRYAPGIASLVEDHLLLTPVDLERIYGLTGGHIFHGEQALDQLYTMRPFLGCARYRGPVRGLYLCGAGTHPGGGIAGASGQNAAREILRDLR